MIRILKKIQSAVRNRTTYRVGLLQAKVYRILKTYTGEKLSKFNISTIEWAFLGLLFDNPEGLRSSYVAEDLGVEAPFITVLCNKLKKMELVDTKSDAKDSRIKIIFLTQKGKSLVPKIEESMYKEMKVLVEGIHKVDVMNYINVLEQMVENGKKVTLRSSRLSDYEGV